MFGKMKKTSAVMVSEGDIFEKKDKVPSYFVVDKLLNFAPAPVHVRLIEKGGNNRLVTVALATLLDEKHWVLKKDI